MNPDALTTALLSAKPGTLQKLINGAMMARPQKSEFYIQYYLTFCNDPIEHLHLERFQKLLLSDYGLISPETIVSDFFRENPLLILPELAILNDPDFMAASVQHAAYTTDEYRQDNWKKLRKERQRLIWKPAFWCVRQNDLPGLEKVVALEDDFDFDMTMYTSSDCLSLIAVAASYNSFECFRFLLVNGATLDMQHQHNTYYQLSPFACACFGGNEEIIQIFLEANVDTSGALNAAINGGRNNVVEWLLRMYPDDIFLYCKYGNPFDYGVYSYNLKGLDLLLDSGWDVECRDGYDWAPIDYSVRDKNDAITYTLLKHGTSMVLTSLAIKSEETYGLLLDYGVSCGNSALSIALMADNTESTILAMSIGQGLGTLQDANRESLSGLSYLIMHPQ